MVIRRSSAASARGRVPYTSASPGPAGVDLVAVDLVGAGGAGGVDLAELVGAAGGVELVDLAELVGADPVTGGQVPRATRAARPARAERAGAGGTGAGGATGRGRAAGGGVARTAGRGDQTATRTGGAGGRPAELVDPDGTRRDRRHPGHLTTVEGRARDCQA